MLAAIPAPTATAAAPPGRPASGPRTEVYDVVRRLDANRLDLFVSNFGSIGYDVGRGVAGLHYPRLDFRTVLFASGLWVGGKVGGQTRVTVAEYSPEWAPGAAPGGVAENPGAADQIVYKTKAYLGDPSDLQFVAGSGAGTPPADAVAHHAWSDYLTGAAPHGAPTRVYRLPDWSTPDTSDSIDVPGPDLPGDLATWCVYNDLDPTKHTNHAGSSLPLGLEVKQTIYGFYRLPGDPDGTLEQAAIVRFQIRNAGPNTIDSTYFGYWSDPDIGGAGDDLTGWDSQYGVGYAYNAWNNDAQYGRTAPAFGIALLDGPLPATNDQPFGVSSFDRFIGGTQPNSAMESFFALRGFSAQGTPWIDPITLQPTSFQCSGDPVGNTGWLDTNPADRTMLVSVGPATLVPGQEVSLTFALVVGQGTNRLDSIRQMRCVTAAVRAAHARGFARPFDALPIACQPFQGPLCPWTAENWSAECSAPTHLDATALEAVANDLMIDTRSFQHAYPQARQNFCAALSTQASARQRAEREFLTFEANLAAQNRSLLLANGSGIGLPLTAPASCPGLTATTVAELAQRCPDGELSAFYQRVDTDRPRDLEAVNWGGEAYDGGIGFGGIFGSSLDPVAQRDSFRTVEIRFGAGQTQKAYRYLRLEAPDGAAPPQGRAYLYAGFHDVPFRCVDIASGRTLDVAFVERAATDFAGTILPPGQQPATFDSTWGPDASADGAREYLFVTNLPTQSAPRVEFEQDGFIAALGSSLPPTMYFVWLRLFEPGEVIEDGELLRIDHAPPSSPGVDRALVLLDRAPQDDPATIQAYEDIAQCLRPINLGQLSAAECRDFVPVLATLVESAVTSEIVALAWFVPDQAAGPFDLERRREREAWLTLATLSPDGSGYLRYEDRAVVPGAHLEYRLVDHRPGGDVVQGAVSVLVPSKDTVRTLSVAVAYAPGRDLALDLALPANGEVTYDLISLAGRRLGGGSFGTLLAGHQTRRIARDAQLTSGVYLVRVRQGTARAVAKAIFVH